MPVVRLSGVYGSVNQKPKEKGAEAPLKMAEDKGIEPSPLPMPLGSSQLCALHGIFH